MSTLTRYAKGSVRELWYISLPLMLSTLSSSLIYFSDRLIVSKLVSKDALNALATAGMPCYIFSFFLIGIVGIAEVFVGQFNGAKKLNRLGEPVWQMLWLCVFFSPIFLLVATLGGEYLIPEQYYELGNPYFFWFTLVGLLQGVVASISAFYIGQGLTRLVFWSTVIVAIINILLNVILVAGFSSYIPAMGTRGSGIASLISQVLQVLILLKFFLSNKNGREFGTFSYKLQPKLLWDCIKIGLPSSIGHAIEIGAWTLLWSILADISDDHITIFAIGQSFFVLFLFITDGLHKGVIAVVSNLLGSKDYSCMFRVQRSALIILAAFAVLMLLPLQVFSDQMIDMFFSTDANIDTIIELKRYASVTLFWVWCYFVFDGIAWVHVGFLMAAGDTIFIMLANTINAILFAGIPIFIFVIYAKGAPDLTWRIIVSFVIANSIVYFVRYKYYPWGKKNIANLSVA